MRTVALFVPMQAGRVHAWPPNLHERNELNDGGSRRTGGERHTDRPTDRPTDRVGKLKLSRTTDDPQSSHTSS